MLSRDGATGEQTLNYRNSTVKVTRGQVDQELISPQIEFNDKDFAMIEYGLSAFVNRRFEAARQSKIEIEQDLLRSLRQRKGQYDPERLKEIRSQGGSEIYMMLTSVKCRATISWLYELLFPAGTTAWSIEATPIPELPKDITDSITVEVNNQATEAMEFAQSQNQELVITKEQAEEVALQMQDMLKERLKDEADERMSRMSMQIEDDIVESDWKEAMQDHIVDVVTYKAGIIKGPVVRREKTLHFYKEQGKTRYKVLNKLKKKYYRVSPFDIYPSPNSKTVNDGYLFERHRLSVPALISMRGVPGYNDKAINEIIDLWGQGGLRNWILNDQQRALLEDRPNEWISREGVIDTLEYSGLVLGKDLLDWGYPASKIEDSNMYYEANIWFVRHIIFKAVLNEDPLGRRGYHKTCFENIPGSFWGHGVPEIMRDSQNMCNAAARSIANNMAIASGPQVEVSTDRLAEGEDIQSMVPWAIWQVVSDPNGTNNPAIRFHNPQATAHLLINVYEFFARLADEHTGIPSYTYGGTGVGGAGKTASGLSMLMTAASRGIKLIVHHLDKTIAGTIKRLYELNMMYHPDESIKGDANVIASGSSSLIAKEQRQVRQSELLATTNNPVDLQIMGLEGRANLLRETVKDMDLKVDDVIPNQDKIMAQAKQAAMQELPGKQPPNANPQTLDAAGDPSNGASNALFQQ